MTEAQLTARFRTEVLPLGQRLLRIAFSVTLNREEAEDVVQDVMLKLWEKREAWDEINSLEAWCFTATRNAAIDRTRHRSEMSWQPQDDNRTAISTPHDELVGSESQEILDRLLSSLPEVQRTIFTMREAEGCSYAEIGKILEISDSQVKTYLLRARRKIRDLFMKTLAL